MRGMWGGGVVCFVAERFFKEKEEIGKGRGSVIY